jgi:hypothetical protein
MEPYGTIPVSHRWLASFSASKHQSLKREMEEKYGKKAEKNKSTTDK